MLENNESRGKGIQLTLWDQPWLSILERCPTYTGFIQKIAAISGLQTSPIWLSRASRFSCWASKFLTSKFKNKQNLKMSTCVQSAVVKTTGQETVIV